MYLKPQVMAEPIIWQWYAWSYLIPPATAACNIVGRHLKIMDSYVSAPAAHAHAVKNPKMLGGPFIDLEGDQTQEVKLLIEQTKAQCAELIALEQSLKECDRMLNQEAMGAGLAEYYSRIPDTLGGMVEIVYDLNNRPSLRLIEPFFYKKYYRTQHQALDLSETKGDYRPFALSTPYLQNGTKFRLNIPFADARLDKLFSAKTTSHRVSDFIELFNIEASQQSQFLSLFTEEAPIISQNKEIDDNYIRVRYFGHACILLETRKVSILIDPVISYPVQSDVIRYTFNDLPERIDYVVLTHNHQDHVMFESLLALRHKIGAVVVPNNAKGSLADPSLKLILNAIGFKSVITLDEMEHISIEDGSILGIPFLGEHSDLNIQTKLGYIINLYGCKFMFLADSNNLDSRLYQHIFSEVGAIDFLFIGMECEGAPLSWLYGPLLSSPIKRTHDYSRTLSGSDFKSAWTMVELSKAKHAYVYAMGQEPWLNYVMALKYEPSSRQIQESDKFVTACRDHGVQSERLFGRKEWVINAGVSLNNSIKVNCTNMRLQVSEA